MISELAFKAGEQKELRISYFARHEGGKVFVSETGSQQEAVFRYRLSIGAVWHGPIRKGKVCITARSVEADEVSIGRPVDKFKRDGVEGAGIGEWIELRPADPVP